MFLWQLRNHAERVKWLEEIIPHAVVGKKIRPKITKREKYFGGPVSSDSITKINSKYSPAQHMLCLLLFLVRIFKNPEMEKQVESQ